MTLRIGTRGSALAMAQASLVAGMLGEDVELVPIATSGDRRVGKDKGRFVKELEEALLAGEVDLAVHSAKDVPSQLPDGLAIVGVPERADARDALCARGGAVGDGRDEPRETGSLGDARDAPRGDGSLAALHEGAVVGTSSLRRRAELLAARPDLDVRELHGNVDTRLRRLADGDFDALVLAAAGLARLGRGAEGAPLDELVPAPGQGCLVLQARADDGRAAEASAAVTDPDALRCLAAERAVVGEVDASCRTPIGVHARLEDGALALAAFVGMPDGSHWIRDDVAGDADRPSDLGRTAAERLLAAGAADLLSAADAHRPA